MHSSGSEALPSVDNSSELFRDRVLSLVRKHDNPYLKLFAFFAVGSKNEFSNDDEGVYGWIDKINRGEKSQISTTLGMLLDRMLNGPQFSDQQLVDPVFFSNLEPTEQQLLLAEFRNSRQAMAEYIGSVIRSDVGITGFDEKYRAILSGAVATSASRRNHTQQEARTIALEQNGYHSEAALQQAVRRIMTDPTAGKVSTKLITKHIDRKAFVLSDEESPYVARQEVTAKKIIDELRTLEERLFGELFERTLKLVGRIQYIELDVMGEQMSSSGKRIRLPEITLANMHKFHVTHFVKRGYREYSLCEGEKLLVIYYENIYSGKFRVAPTEWGYPFLSPRQFEKVLQLHEDASSLEPEKLQQHVVIRAELELLRHLRQSITILEKGLAARNPLVLSSPDFLGHCASVQSGVLNWSEFVRTKINQEVTPKPTYAMQILEYISEQLALRQRKINAAADGFAITELGIVDPKDLSLQKKIELLIKKNLREAWFANIQQAFHDVFVNLMGNTSHETGADENSQSKTEKPSLVPWWIIAASQLRTVLNPRFILQSKSASPVQQMKAMRFNEVSTYTPQSIAKFKTYIFPNGDSLKGRDVYVLKSHTPVAAGREVIGKVASGMVLRLWLPQYAELCALNIMSAKGAGQVAFEYKKDYTVQHDSEVGYYRVVFTTAGEQKLLLAGSQLLYEAEIAESTSVANVRQFTVEQEQKLHEVISALRDAGYVKIADQLQKRSVEKKHPTISARVAKTLLQKMQVDTDSGTSSFKTKIAKLLSGIVDRDAFNSSDIAYAVKAGARYSFRQDQEFEQLRLCDQFATLPKPDESGRLVGQCVHSSILLATILRYIYADGKVDSTLVTPPLFTGLPVFGTWRVLYGGGHQNLRGRQEDNVLTHDATAPLLTAVHDLFRKIKVLEDAEGNDEAALSAVRLSQQEKKVDADKKNIFAEIERLSKEYVSAMLQTISLQHTGAMLGLGNTVPQYIRRTGKVLHDLQKSTVGTDPVFLDVANRGSLLLELKRVASEWNTIQLGLVNQGIGTNAGKRSQVRQFLGPGIEHASWVARELASLVKKIEEFE